MKQHFPLFAALILFFSGMRLAWIPAHAEERTITLANRSVVYWGPQTADSQKQPLILFSHGFHGSATQSRFLMEALAAHGYWVFAPNHQDARGQQSGKPQEKFNQPTTWTQDTYRDRQEDIHQILIALQADPRFKDQIDFAHLGLAGHSLGGYTVLGLAGGWPSWKLSGVSAVLALSPYSQPFNLAGTLGALKVPVMLQTGTRDLGIAPSLQAPGGTYDQLRSPKYFLSFNGAGHLAWSNLSSTAHQNIEHYSVTFFDHYLKGKPEGKTLTHSLPGVSVLWYQSEWGNQQTPASGHRSGLGRRALNRGDSWRQNRQTGR